VPPHRLGQAPGELSALTHSSESTQAQAQPSRVSTFPERQQPRPEPTSSYADGAGEGSALGVPKAGEGVEGGVGSSGEGKSPEAGEELTAEGAAEKEPTAGGGGEQAV